MRFKAFIITFFSLIAMGLLFINAYYVWNWGDDYVFKLQLKKQSVVELLWNDFLTFDGRSLSLGYFISRTCLKYDFPFLASFIATFFMIASAWVLKLQSNIKINNFQGIVLFTILLWLGSFYSLSETLYWQTGTLYIVELTLIFGVYHLVSRMHLNQLLVFALSLLAGIASPGAVIGILVVLIFEFLWEKENIKKRRIKFSIFGFLAGLIIVIDTPGSLNRYHSESNFDAGTFSNFSVFYFRIHQFIDQFLNRNTPITWVILAVGVLMAILLVTKEYTNSNKVIRMGYRFRWLIAAVLTLAVYFPRMKYYILLPRLNVHFVFYVMMFFAATLSEFKSEQVEEVQNPLQFLQIVALFAFSIVAFYQCFGSRHCYWKMQTRVELYNKMKGQELVLKANDIIGPPATKEFIDVGYDENYALNQWLAEYYGLKTIRKMPYR